MYTHVYGLYTYSISQLSSDRITPLPRASPPYHRLHPSPSSPASSSPTANATFPASQPHPHSVRIIIYLVFISCSDHHPHPPGVPLASHLISPRSAATLAHPPTTIIKPLLLLSSPVRNYNQQYSFHSPSPAASPLHHRHRQPVIHLIIIHLQGEGSSFSSPPFYSRHSPPRSSLHRPLSPFPFLFPLQP